MSSPPGTYRPHDATPPDSESRRTEHRPEPSPDPIRTTRSATCSRYNSTSPVTDNPSNLLTSQAMIGTRAPRKGRPRQNTNPAHHARNRAPRDNLEQTTTAPHRPQRAPCVKKPYAPGEGRNGGGEGVLPPGVRMGVRVSPVPECGGWFRRFVGEFGGEFVSDALVAGAVGQGGVVAVVG